MRHSSKRLYSATTLLIVSSEPALTAATANTRCPTMRHNLVLSADLASPTWKSSKSYSMSVGTSARHPGLPLSRSWTSKDIGCRQESRVESGGRQALRGVEGRRQKQRRKILGAVKSQESRARWKAEGKSTSPCLPPHLPRTVRGVAATQVPQHFPTVSRWKHDWQTRGALNHSIGDPPCTIAFSYTPPPQSLGSLSKSSKTIRLQRESTAHFPIPDVCALVRQSHHGALPAVRVLICMRHSSI